PFMVVQSALAILLSRLSTSTDIAFGFPTAGRTHPTLDNLIGFFVNTLILRVDLTNNPTFTQLLTHIRHQSLAAYDHQDLPFDTLVDHLNPTRTPAHHPLIQILLAWQNLPDTTTTPLHLGNLDITTEPINTHTARMDLTISLHEHHTPTGTPHGIHGAIEYRTDIYNPTTITTLITR
ncbi:condensation domain-containing protein, partial [Mycolicibacterium obuense]